MQSELNSRIIGYCRTSKRRRESSNEVSIDRQIESIRNHCKQNNLSAPRIIADQRVSGGSETRAGYQELIQVIEQKLVDIVVIYSLDRIVRQLDLQLAFTKKVKSMSVKVISLTDGVDLNDSTPEGIFQANLHGALAQLYRNKISQKMSLAWRYKRERNERYGGRTSPFGFDVDYSTKKLIPNLDEQSAIKLMRQLREEQGYSFSKIAKTLKELNIRTKISGSTWSHRTIQKILSRNI